MRVTQYGVSGSGGLLHRALGRYSHGPNAATVVGQHHPRYVEKSVMDVRAADNIDQLR